MDWILSFLSMVVLWLMGNKNKYAPIVGIATQLLWIFYALKIGQVGLIVGTVGYLIVHIRNAGKWNKTPEYTSERKGNTQ